MILKFRLCDDVSSETTAGRFAEEYALKKLGATSYALLDAKDKKKFDKLADKAEGFLTSYLAVMTIFVDFDDELGGVNVLTLKEAAKAQKQEAKAKEKAAREADKAAKKAAREEEKAAEKAKKSVLKPGDFGYVEQQAELAEEEHKNDTSADQVDQGDKLSSEHDPEFLP